MKARYWPCVSVKRGPDEDWPSPHLRVMATSIKEAAMNIRYRVELSQAERSELQALLSGGRHAARKLKRAQILLAAEAGVEDEAIAASVGVSGSTVSRTKRDFIEGNLDRALNEK